MLILSGKNLSDRHREFNLRVNEAVYKKTNFSKVISEEEHSDVDKLFRIDLASRYRKIDYILETLKSGDNLYITRALKCTWIHNDEHSNVINPNYLHHNLFPYMSQRMKAKMLTTVSLHVRNEDRNLCFYSYCLNSKLNKLATKFLMKTSEAFKLDLITNCDDLDVFNNAKYLKHFIGTSFALATAYVDIHWERCIPVIHELRFLYFRFKEGYLDLLEKYGSVDAGYIDNSQRYGIRISRDILKQHKSRVWADPILYLNKLNKNMLIKYLTSEDVQHLATLLLPTTSAHFWSMDFYHSYKFVLDLVPYTQIFAYLKKIFSNKYDGESFEMNLQFYKQKYYEILTAKEQESWAMLHIKREEELFGIGNDFIWYKFVGFDKALVEIRKYVLITPDKDKRSEIVNILIECTKSQEDLIKLLNYYYEWHVNENFKHKMSFINHVILKHDLYAFTEECWTLFEKLLYSLEVYTRRNLYEYVMKSMIYYIINNKEFSNDLKYFMEQIYGYYGYYEVIMALSEERRSLVLKYCIDFHANKLKVLLENSCDDNILEQINVEVSLVWNVIWSFDRNEKECPETVLNYMLSHMDLYQYHPAFKEKFQAMSEEDFVRLLKKDTELVIENISNVMCNAYRWSFRLNRLFRKLKVYFSKDVSEEYLQYFIDSLDWLGGYGRQYRNIKMAVVGVFQLGSEESKVALLEKYAPTNPKINRGKIDTFLLQVQKAICRLSYQSRPPIKLSSILKYVTGDYVHFSLPMFYNYSANLPMNQAIEFIYKIIDSPVSIQKHGLRLAFKFFNSEDLIHIITSIWKKTKNVSLRLVLYKTLYKKIVDERGDLQIALFDVLKGFTTELNHHDHEYVFKLLVSADMPEELRGEYIETAWLVVSRFSNKILNLARKIKLIYHIKENIYLLERKFLREHIIDEHLRKDLHKNIKGFLTRSQQIGDLSIAKWDLTAAFIVSGNDVPEIFKENQNLVKDILLKCLQMWSHQYMGIYTVRQFCNIFLKTLHNESCVSSLCYINVIPIYKCVLDVLQISLPKEQLFLLTWELQLYINSGKVVKQHFESHNGCMQYKYPCVVEIAEAFAKTVRDLVEELMNRKEFYYSFYPEMTNAIKTVCETMDRGMDTSGFEILVSGYLTRFIMKETHIFAVMLIPKDPPKDWEKRHENALNMIKQYSNEEINSQLHYKFETKGKIRNIL